MKNILQYTIDYQNIIYPKKLGVTDSGFKITARKIIVPLNVNFHTFS